MVVVIDIQEPLLIVFQPSWLPLFQLGFLALHIHAKNDFSKKEA